MNTTVGNLDFMINLIDKVSGPMGRVMKAVDQAQIGFQKGFTQIGVGAASLVGAAYSVNNLLEPTKEMQRALGEVKSLGVADDTLQKLQDTALKFSSQYGIAAADVVRSSYDIQSAIAGLSGNELARFTEVSGVLAKGTKANVADVTNYVGTMYGIFQKSADAMGKAQWIEQMAAQTAMAVNIFKTDGKGMAQAFTAIGAAAQNFGVSSAEQFAVLGKLQATMSGSEAGTKYRSFLDNVGKAQKILNLRFTDAQGHMLPIVDILGKINKKFGDIDKVSESGLLKKAFGTDEAVALIKLLNNDIGGLRNNIIDIGNQKGLSELNKMADAMTDPWAKMRTGVEGISISIGTRLLPVVLPTIAGINDITQNVIRWTNVNPELSKWIGILTLATFGFIGTLALFSIIAGYATIVSTGWGLAMKLIFNPLKNAALAVWGMIPAIWSFTAALLANPITWWVLGITAGIAIVVAAVYWWKEWTGAVVDFASRFLEMVGVFSLVDNVLSSWEGLKQWWASFKAWLSTLNPFEAIMAGVNRVTGALNAFKSWAATPISIGSGLVSIGSGSSISTASGSVSTGPRAAPTGGGILKQISSVNANRSTSIGAVNVNNYGQPMSGAKLRDELLFAGG